MMSATFAGSEAKTPACIGFASAWLTVDSMAVSFGKPGQRILYPAPVRRKSRNLVGSTRWSMRVMRRPD
jgi:hypothetical protein